MNDAPPSLPQQEKKPAKNPLVVWLVLACAAAAFFACTTLFVFVQYGLLYEKGREMPIEVWFRQAVFGKGMVAEFRNRSNTPLKVAVDFRSPSTGTTSTREMVIERQGSAEVGWAEGWKFVPGDELSIRHSRFTTKRVIVPELKEQ